MNLFARGGARAALARTTTIALVASLATAVGATALVAVSTATASAARASTPATLAVSGSPTLTLPATDGFNDRTQLAIRSNAKITVKVVVVTTAGKLVKTVKSSLALGAESGGYGATINVGAGGLKAGTYLARVTRVGAASPSDTTALVVGSGRAVSVSVAPRTTTLYPYRDGHADTASATITTKDETGTAVPFHGTLKIVSDGHTKHTAISNKAGGSVTKYVTVAGLPLGTAKLSARLAGATGAAKRSAEKNVRLLSTRVTAISLDASRSTVFPAKDDFRDDTVLSVTQVASTSAAFPTAYIPVTGRVVVAYKGTTVRSWDLTTSGPRHLTWDGRNNGAIVPGTYTVTATAKGPQGTSRTTKGTLTVSARQLVTRTTTVWKDADDILTSHRALDDDKQGHCDAHSGELDCLGYDARTSDRLSLISTGSIAVPAAVRSNAKYWAPRLAVGIDVNRFYGSGSWSFGSGSATSGMKLSSGIHTPSSLRLTGSPASVRVTAQLGAYAVAFYDRFRVKFVYKVLQ